MYLGIPVEFPVIFLHACYNSRHKVYQCNCVMYLYSKQMARGMNLDRCLNCIMCYVEHLTALTFVPRHIIQR